MALKEALEAAFDTDDEGNIVVDPEALPEYDDEVESVTAEAQKKLPHPEVEYGNLTTTSGVTVNVPEHADPLQIAVYAHTKAVTDLEQAHAARVEQIVRKDD